MPRNLKRGGRHFLFPFPLKISVKTKKKVFTSFDVQFTPKITSRLSSSNLPPKSSKDQKKGQRVLRCPVSTVSLTADMYKLIFQQGGRGTTPAAPLPGYAPVYYSPVLRFSLSISFTEFLFTNLSFIKMLRFSIDTDFLWFQEK